MKLTTAMRDELEYICSRTGFSYVLGSRSQRSTEAKNPRAASALFARELVDRIRQGSYDDLTERRRSYLLYWPTVAGRKLRRVAGEAK